MTLLWDWANFWARPSQAEPAWAWETWLILAGRGYGKTRTGAEWVRNRVETGRARRLGLLAPTAGDARDVMVEGESGILAISRPDFYPHYEPSKRRITWPNGAMATLYSAEEPNRLRGPQHDAVWADEPAAWKNASDVWDMMQFGLRLGDHPQAVATTTPRPIRLIRELVKDPTCAVTGGNTYENAANLSPSALRRLKRRYEGTTLGRQELYAILLDEVPGAMWKRSTIEQNRVDRASVPEMTRIVVGCDPAVTSGEKSDMTGVVVVGLGTNGEAYVLWDGTLRAQPFDWATRVVQLYRHYQADAVVAEVNNGGDLVEYTIATVDASVNVSSVHAARGKRTRAEPVAALYEQGRVHHLALDPYRDKETGKMVPVLEDLEDQMVSWTHDQDESPDRIDALVWAIWKLMIEADEVLWEYEEAYEIDTSY